MNLGSAGNYLVLSETGITDVHPSAITGNIGASPITGAARLVTCPAVTGTISAVGVAGLAPCALQAKAALSQAVLDMQSAYTDAAGRTLPDYTELGGGNISGMTLAPGLYKWSTGVSVDNTGVTLSGGPNAVWIFQIAGDIMLASNARITLAGGAQANNVFWQAGGPTAVTLGTGAVFAGNILSSRQVIMNTGATVVGRALAFTQVTPQMNGITSPGPLSEGVPVLVPPTVTFTFPGNTATGVATGSTLSATFSETMDPTTITALTFTLQAGGVPVAGIVGYSGSTATFAPAATLLPNTTYTATITTGAKDPAGVALAGNYVWTFTTVPAIVLPSVSSTVPANGATNVPVGSALSATFSTPMNPATINYATFLLRQGGTDVTGTVSYSGVTATFTPASLLAPNVPFTASITTGATDLTGNPLASNYVWFFTTGATTDSTPPTVSSTVPANGATNVSVGHALSATFSKPMNPATITNATFFLRQGGTPVAGTVTYAGVTATFTPTSLLAPNASFTATITTGAADLSRNALAGNYLWAFTTGATPDTTPPAVSSRVPADGATNVPVGNALSATFSEPMSPATINTSTFLLKQGSTAVVGTVNYAGVTATFTPASLLAPNVPFTATITTGVTDLAGNALVSNYVWSFTTGATSDTTPPTVSSTAPASGAANVPVGNALLATFSKPMNTLTINTSTFLLKQGGTAVAGAVTYAGVTATFTPTSLLAPNVPFTATITTGVTDLAGNALVGNYVWTFTTGATPDNTPPTVSFMVPTTGSINVPVGNALSATFSKTIDPLTINTSTFLLNQGGTAIKGAVTYAGVTAMFTPTGLLAPNVPFTATITTGVTDLAGNALVSNYVWTFTTGAPPDTTPPTVSSTLPAGGTINVPVVNALSATFSKPMNPLTINNTTFHLTQGGVAVAGAVTYAGVTATFTPLSPLAPNVPFTATITTGVNDLAGNALVGNYVWSFTTGAPPDTTPPTVSSTVPANGPTNVPVGNALSATFSEPMNPLTINTSTFVLKQGNTAVAGAVIYAGLTATFTPASLLAPNVPFTATISTDVTDLAGNALAFNYVWSFTTGATPITAPPTVSSTVPVNGATNVPVGNALSATFSKPMNPLTINASTFLLKQGGAAVAGAVTYAGVTATFTPTSPLAPNVPFTATITTGATDLAGNALVINYVWSFTAGVTPDTTPPAVSSTAPANGATGIPLGNALAATFSKPMNPLTINASTFTLQQGSTAVAAAVTYAGVTATFTPASLLAPNVPFTGTITTGVTDLAGNALGSNYVWTFTTGATLDTTPPIVSSTAPASGATNVTVGNALSATFSEPMNPLTVSTATFLLTQGGTAVAGAVTYAGVTATFTPLSSLAPGVPFTATITTGVTDLAGNALATNYAWNFNTVAPPVITPTTPTSPTTPPSVISTVPGGGATNVPVGSALSATFSEPMNPLTVNTATFLLKQGSSSVAGTVTYIGVTATFTPLSSLAPNAQFTATITNGVIDSANNSLAYNYVWTFTTGAAASTTGPQVISTAPATGATLPTLTANVTAVFSEPMNPLTISTGTFLLTAGITPVPGTVAYSGTTATFTPSGSLSPNTVYSAAITTGASDLAGNSLRSMYAWTFTTGASDSQTPVCLANFAVLSNSGVVNVGSTTIMGDIGVGEGASVYGFPPGAFNGKMHVGDADTTKGMTDAAAAYADAESRSAGMAPLSGDLGGQTLTPGLYRSLSSLAISSGDLTLDAKGNVNAVFIFQIASTLTMSPARQIILAGGAQAFNVFWQVGTSATLGANSTFLGSILARQSINVNAGAVVNGRLLALGGTHTLLTNKITSPPPSIAAGAVLNGASWTQNVAAGSIATVIGNNLASSLTASAGIYPLLTTLGGTSIQVGVRNAPLLMAACSQANLQIPWEVLGQTNVMVTATAGGLTSSLQPANVVAFAPGIFALNQAGSGQGAVEITPTALVAAPQGTGSRPVMAGEYISIFCTGLGPVSNQPPTGAAASSSPLSPTTTMPTVTIGGIAAQVTYSGLAPGFAGLYQVNAQVPQGVLPGSSVSLVIGIGGIQSNTVTIAVGSGSTKTPEKVRARP